MIRETKRIGATTFSSMKSRPPGLCPLPRYKARSHGYTINDATMRLCGADHPASRHPVAAGGSCIMQAIDTDRVRLPSAGVVHLPSGGYILPRVGKTLSSLRHEATLGGFGLRP